jgi:hypothetical protein
MKYCVNRHIQSLICVLLISIAFLASCQKDDKYRQPESTDKTKPGIVTDVKVKNFNGGAILTYTLPTTENLLYVVADYKINDKVSRETKSSYFLDTIRVEGFSKSQDYTITLHAVTRANIASDPVTITVHPDTPYYQLIRKSLLIAPDFGGINIMALNPGKRAVAVNMVAIDPANGKFEIQDQHYSSTDTIDYSVRGYTANPTKFGVYVSDQFGNVSDTSIVTLTPLFEEMLPKSKFFTYQTNSDAAIGYGWELPNLWNGLTDESGGSIGWHTTAPPNKLLQCTFGIGATYKLSHFVMWARPSASYGYGNPRDFTIWGSTKDNPADAVTPGGTAVGTVVGDWVVLGNYHFPNPPSGLLPGQTNAADAAFIDAGVSFDVPFISPAVKYIRLDVKDTWGGVYYTHLMELSFYGSPQ